jgi:hypothetical protein
LERELHRVADLEFQGRVNILAVGINGVCPMPD